MGYLHIIYYVCTAYENCTLKGLWVMAAQWKSNVKKGKIACDLDLITQKTVSVFLIWYTTWVIAAQRNCGWVASQTDGQCDKYRSPKVPMLVPKYYFTMRIWLSIYKTIATRDLYNVSHDLPCCIAGCAIYGGWGWVWGLEYQLGCGGWGGYIGSVYPV